jgi:hypothetical protein
LLALDAHTPARFSAALGAASATHDPRLATDVQTEFEGSTVTHKHPAHLAQDGILILDALPDLFQALHGRAVIVPLAPADDQATGPIFSPCHPVNPR